VGAGVSSPAGGIQPSPAEPERAKSSNSLQEGPNSLRRARLLHLHGDVRVGRSLVGVGVRNLFDHAYTELRASGFVVPGQPRSVYGAILYLF
jgi:hypothetical protein